jgi:hypothetical protein
MSDEGGSEETEAALPWWLRRRFARRVLFPVVTVGSLITALVVFNHILIPFIFACAILTAGGALVAPQFVTELKRFADGSRRSASRASMGLYRRRSE